MEENICTCVDISEEYFFNCPPNICEGHYLTKIVLTSDGLEFHGEKWIIKPGDGDPNNPDVVCLSEKNISLEALDDILHFLIEFKDYIVENAVFS